MSESLKLNFFLRRQRSHYTFLYGDNVSAGIPKIRDSNANCAVEIITGEQEARVRPGSPVLCEFDRSPP